MLSIFILKIVIFINLDVVANVPATFNRGAYRPT